MTPEDAAKKLMELCQARLEEGHSHDCRARVGPPGEQWLEWEQCNCLLRTARAILGLPELYDPYKADAI